MKKVAILYAKLRKNSSKDEEDVIEQVKCVKKALRELDYNPIELPMTLNLKKSLRNLKEIKPFFVFNLIESLSGKDSLVSLVPNLLDAIGVKYTGAPTEAFHLTTNKIIAKKILKNLNIETPFWMTFNDVLSGNFMYEPPYIVKSIWDHASIGLDEESVFYDKESLKEEVLKRRDLKEKFFIEQFIDGREFNLSLLGGNDNPEVLPLAEIRFIDYPEDKPKVVGYKAKWESSSYEYNNTPRTFDISIEDSKLIDELKRIAVKCWYSFELRGYARVDFRVDKNNKPYVLEVNTNPCLSPDAGFLASARRAGLDIKTVIKRIIEDSLK